MRPALKHRPAHSPVAALPAGRRSPSSLPAAGRRVAGSRRHGESKKYSWIQQKQNMVKAKIGAVFSSKKMMIAEQIARFSFQW